jgi:hypothetical protein
MGKIGVAHGVECGGGGGRGGGLSRGFALRLLALLARGQHLGEDLIGGRQRRSARARRRALNLRREPGTRIAGCGG